MVSWTRGRTAAAGDKTSTSDKPVECIHPDNLPKADKDNVAVALVAMVDRSAAHADVNEGLHMNLSELGKDPWFKKLIPGLEKLANKYHIGNYVIVRDTNKKVFESMPLYAR